MIEENFNPLDYVDDDLNRRAIELIRKGDKEAILNFVNFYLKKMKSRSMRKMISIITHLKGNIIKRMHPTLLKIEQEHDKIFLKLLSKMQI